MEARWKRLLHGGAVWDGSGRPAFPADVLVEGNRIAQRAFVEVAPRQGHQRIDHGHGVGTIRSEV